MSTVTPIEPRLRRRDVTRPRTVVERGVAIPVTRELPPARLLPPPRAVPQPLTEVQLARRFFPLAAAVVAADLATKAWAASGLAERSVRLVSGVELTLVYNRLSAGSVSIGPHTRPINFVATGIVVGLIVMLVPALARVHRASWAALALIAGAGIGNLASMLSGGRGVVDFIALHHDGGAWVLNVADVALAAGLVLLTGTIATLGRAILRGERAGVR